MTHPYRELAQAIVDDLDSQSIPAVRTRMHRISKEKLGEIFGSNPAVVISKARVARNLDQVGRDSRNALVVVAVTVIGKNSGRDPEDPTEEDAFDDYVQAVDKALDGNLETPTYGEATWVESNEIDDNEYTKTLGDLQTTMEISYIIQSTEV